MRCLPASKMHTIRARLPESLQKEAAGSLTSCVNIPTTISSADEIKIVFKARQAGGVMVNNQSFN